MNIKDTNWKIIFMIPFKDLIKDMIPIMNIGIIIAFFTILFLVIIGYILGNSIYKPIYEIVSDIERIGREDQTYRIQVKVENEIGIISDRINKMLERIETMAKKIMFDQDLLYKYRIAVKQAELSALQGQINPHFLYNTLECIRSIALSNRIMEIVNICVSMAKIFRYCIKESEIVTLRDELECVKDYFNIISIRYMGKIHIDVSVDSNILDLRINKMVLQPIVENAVYHGLETLKRDGYIVVKGYRDSSCFVVLEINDNGKGIGEEELNKLNCRLNAPWDIVDYNISDSRSIGLLNISQRLKITFGEKCEIHVSSSLNEGTKVKIVLPFEDNTKNT